MKNILLILFMITLSNLASAVCSSTIARSNFSSNQILTSARLNTELNTVYARANELPGDCITTGTVTTTQISDGTITNADIASGAAIARTKLSPAINYTITTDSGAFTTTSGTLTDVTNLSASITTTGGPVEVSLIPKESATLDFTNSGYINAGSTQLTAESSFLAVLRAGTVIASQLYYTDSSLADDFDTGYPCSSFRYVDFPTTGTHTYKIQAKTTKSISVSNCRLLVREL